MHPVQQHGSKGTIEMSLASRIALGNTGESCSPSAVSLTESGKKHIDENKRIDKALKKKVKKHKMKKSDLNTFERKDNISLERKSASRMTFSASSNCDMEWVKL